MLDVPSSTQESARSAIDQHYRADEAAIVRGLLEQFSFAPDAAERIHATARELVQSVRARAKGGLDAFLHEYGLSTREGVMLMCIAEALLRIPDEDTQEALIRDKISAANWDRHLGRSDSVFVNASTWALMLTGRLVSMHGVGGQTPGALLRRLVARAGEPVIREAVTQAMRIMGGQFVMGRTIEEGLERAQPFEQRGYRFSYDMLGEAARTLADSDRFFEAYRSAIDAIGKAAAGKGVVQGPGISVKLSALHPRYELHQHRRVMDELVPRLQALAQLAAGHDIGLNIDAEEADRLDLSLDVIEAVAASPALAGWEGLGVVVQAYQKRAPFVLDWVEDLARRHQRRLMVRLVKGAYWDTEIKRAQELALDGYPVYTRKVNTDVCYLACAQKLLDANDVIYPQFATHNAHTIAAVLELAGTDKVFEFQRLHGMGEELYEAVAEGDAIGAPCRIYAPVGQHADLLAYLVRRLLENGANSSFVNRVQDEALPVEAIIADPLTHARSLAYIPHPRILLPRNLYGADRLNFAGLDLNDRAVLERLDEELDKACAQHWQAGPMIAGELRFNHPQSVVSPSDHIRSIGEVSTASIGDVNTALEHAVVAAERWNTTPVSERAAALKRLAALMEQHSALLMAIAVEEAGKTLNDALAEVREAVDFCRYYALQAEQQFGAAIRLRVPRESNTEVQLTGGGVFCCISPWNFPLAIFTGQITAALAAGNAVIAKPAAPTPLIAAAAVRLMHEAGIPGDVVQLLPGDGQQIGGALVADTRVTGVCFTGSTAVAQIINRTLAGRDGPPAPFIAETGGINTMIADSSALPEQVTRDVLTSAFQSAGQRCSALRVLLVQEDVADPMIDMIRGAMDELSVGDPRVLATDIGPVIDNQARDALEDHIRRMRGEGRLIKQVKLGPGTGRGSFVAPTAFEIERLSQLQQEVFGPVLHVVRYAAAELPTVLDAINASGYGLTHGVHTRVDETRDRILGTLKVGNAYVNRHQIGAVVGVQPFGGEGLSGTGPKAGGPHYVPRFARERVAGEVPEPAPSVGGARILDCTVAPDAFDACLSALAAGHEGWRGVDGRERAVLLERAADSLAQVDEVAADYLHFYAAQCEAELVTPMKLPGPTGELNTLAYTPRGIVACLSLLPGTAALMVQAGAALAAGNSVLLWHAQPEAALEAHQYLLEAGFPAEVVVAATKPGDLLLTGALTRPELAAVALAGNAEDVHELRVALAGEAGPVRPLIPFATRDAGTAERGEALAGSPRYLYRFVLERTVSIDTTASGGNTGLFSLE